MEQAYSEGKKEAAKVGGREGEMKSGMVLQVLWGTRGVKNGVTQLGVVPEPSEIYIYICVCVCACACA